MWMFVPLSLAQSPLQLDVAPLSIAPIATWKLEAERGEIRVEAVAEGARLTYSAGTQARLCSPTVPVAGGRTVRVTGKVRGESTLGDAAGIHLIFYGVDGELQVARRRVDAGDQGWEPLSILATAPPPATRAALCVDLRMVKADEPGALVLGPLGVDTLSAQSRSRALPLRRVVLVTVEALRTDHLSMHGYPRKTSPNLDALAQSGACFEQHITNAPYTHPSLATLLTSQFPTTLGFLDNLPTLPPAMRTLADYFAEAGYVTAAFNAQYVLSNRYGLNQGFHYYRNWPNDTPSSKINDELLPWLSTHAEDNSFVWVHYFDPHGPYRPPAAFREPFLSDSLYLGDPMLLPLAPGSGAYIPAYVLDKTKKGPARNERRHYVAGYDGDIAWWDQELGRLLGFLKEKGWDQDTLVMVTPDHGESMTDHGRYFSHGSLYQHDLHVPLVMSWPGKVPAGVEVKARSSHLDLLPTLLDYAGIPAVAGLVGQSLRPAVESRPFTPAMFSAAVVGRGDKLRYAAIGEGRFKLITDGSFTLQELYDLGRDPDELQDLSARPPREAEKMLGQFTTWFAQTFPVMSSPEVQALDTEDAERLRSLGYVE